MDVFPAIDIRDGQLVRLIQGDYDQQINYPQNPVDVAKRFRQAGAAWLHIVDLDGAKTGRIYNTAVIKDILNAVDLRVQVGGGIRTQRAIQKLLDAGAARVIIGTMGLEDWGWFRDIVHDREFAEKIVLGMDARDGHLAVRGWTEQTKISALDVARKVSDWPLAAIVYTDIARDGMLLGPNFDQVEVVAKSTDIPVIASGGVTSLDDVRKLKELSVEGVIIGRALYEGKIDLAEAIRIANE